MEVAEVKKCEIQALKENKGLLNLSVDQKIGIFAKILIRLDQV